MFMRRGSRREREARGIAAASSSSSSSSPPQTSCFTAGVVSLESSSSASALQVGDPKDRNKSGGNLARKKGRSKKDRCSYRSQLELEVQNLQKQLQEETNLGIALENAIGQNSTPILTSSILPDEIQELLFSVSVLEMVVSRLEEDLISLHFLLGQERNERPLVDCHQIMEAPIISTLSPSFLSDYSVEQKSSPSRASQCGHPSCSLQFDSFVENRPSPLDAFNSVRIGSEQANHRLEENVSSSCSVGEKEDDRISLQVDDVHTPVNLWQDPSSLSEQMVQCMRNIFLHLSESSSISSKSCIHHSSCQAGQLSCNSLASLSGSSIMPSPTPIFSTNLHRHHEDVTLGNTFDPYGANWKENQITIGFYSSAAEVSWMTVGKKRLEYAGWSEHPGRETLARLGNRSVGMKVHPQGCYLLGSLVF